MDIIILDKILKTENDAGFKARLDVINILEKMGGKYIPIPRNFFRCGFKLIKTKFLNKNLVVIQHPLNKKIQEILLLKVKIHKATSVCFIHDINSLRENLDNNKIREEINLFNKYDYIISHNKKMTEWLKNNCVKSEILELEIFDYISSENQNKRNIGNKYSVSYATGKLGTEKSLFLYDIDKEINDKFELLLYGNIDLSFKEQLKFMNNINYKGSLDSNEITRKIEGDFGLIWDSISIDECSGIWANYNRYNNPHKLSMYLAAKLPVIVWNESAIASFVRKNNIGICIDSIKDIASILSKITEDEYNNMVKNVEQISKDICSGRNTENIFKEIIEL